MGRVREGNIPQIDRWDESARGIFHTSVNHLAVCLVVDSGRAGIFSRRTNQTQERGSSAPAGYAYSEAAPSSCQADPLAARCYIPGPIRPRKCRHILTTDPATPIRP
eukprot:377231-Prorocentrum_minimum.AAC.1